jgi:hypothetical protein
MTITPIFPRGVNAIVAGPGGTPVTPAQPPSPNAGNLTLEGAGGIQIIAASSNTIIVDGSGIVTLGGVKSLTGNSGGPVSPAALTGNVNIQGTGSVQIAGTPSSNLLTVSVSGGGLFWSDQGVNATVNPNTGSYVTAGGIVLTLPPSPSNGDVCCFLSIFSVTTQFTVAANGGQFIFGPSAATDPLTAKVSSLRSPVNNLSAYITLVYRVTDSTWYVIDVSGSWKP